MINYSIVMRSVNANLLEINQAKSRINQAKKEGKTPDPKDLELVKTENQNAFAISQYTDIMTIEKFAKHITELVKTENQNAFAISQYTDIMTIEKFAKHITSHGSVYSRADISAILYIAVDCMREMLLEGKKIRLGDLGDFSILLTSKGAEDADKFTSQNITGVKDQWEPGQEFNNLRDDAEINLVASRSAQAAVIKAIKEGKTNVDLNAPTTPDNTPGGSTPGGSNTGQTGSDGQGVASRSAQAAVIKAIKEGKTNVDLNAPTTPDNTPGGSTPGGSNTGQTGSEGQGSESGGSTGDTGDGLE